LAEILAVGSQDGLNTVFDFGNGNTLTLENSVLTELTEDDFVFDSVGAVKPEGTIIASADVLMDGLAEMNTLHLYEIDWVSDAFV